MLIYKITNLINNKCYIGLTTKSTFRARYNYRDDWWNGHSVNRLVCASVKKHGAQNFKIDILDYGVDLWDLCNLEQFYIKQYNSLSPNGYNLTTGGEFCAMSEETKKILSSVKIGKPGTKGNAKGHKKSQDCTQKATASRQKRFNDGTLKPWNKGLKTGRPLEAAILKSANAHKKPVKCSDLQGNVLKIYDGLIHTKDDGFNPSQVSLCCKHPFRYRTHRNLKWEYV